MTVAEKLAVIDGNQGREAEYTQRLTTLTRKCGEPQMSVSDIAVRGTQVMQEKRGVSMSSLEFLDAMDDAIPDEATGAVNCTEIAAVLVAITGQ